MQQREHQDYIAQGGHRNGSMAKEGTANTAFKEGTEKLAWKKGHQDCIAKEELPETAAWQKRGHQTRAKQSVKFMTKEGTKNKDKVT